MMHIMEGVQEALGIGLEADIAPMKAGLELLVLSIEGNDCIELVLSTKFSELSGIGNALFESLQPYLDKIVVTYLQKVLRIRLKKEGNWIRDLQSIVIVIRTLYKKYSKKQP